MKIDVSKLDELPGGDGKGFVGGPRPFESCVEQAGAEMALDAAMEQCLEGGALIIGACPAAGKSEILKAIAEEIVTQSGGCIVSCAGAEEAGS